MGVFREIVVYFLLVGHTGNSVDQLFSILTQEFKKSEIKTVDELIEIIQKSPITPQPSVESLNYTWDWKNFVTGYLTGKQLENHSFYNAFNIVKEGKKTKLRAKRLPQDQEWFPPTGIELIQQNIPFDEPVRSSGFRVEDLNLPKVLWDLQKYFKRMPTHLRVSISSSWNKLKETLEGLPRMQNNLPPMKLSDLPKMQLNLAPVLSDEFDFVDDDPNDLPVIKGNVCEEGLFNSNIREIMHFKK